MPDAARLGEVEPIYETVPGWSEEIQGVTERSDLPLTAREYLTRIEEIVGVPIDIVSVGPERSQTVLADGCAAV